MHFRGRACETCQLTKFLSNFSNILNTNFRVNSRYRYSFTCFASTERNNKIEMFDLLVQLLCLSPNSFPEEPASLRRKPSTEKIKTKRFSNWAKLHYVFIKRCFLNNAALLKQWRFIMFVTQSYVQKTKQI